MPEYINKNQLRLMTAEERERRSFDYELGWKACVEWVKALPAADVREDVKGEWLRTDAYPHRLYCSACYATFIRNDEFLKLVDIPNNYCPNCGAQMGGAEDG